MRKVRIVFSRLMDQLSLVPFYINSLSNGCFGRRQIVVVHGNCQAIPTARLLRKVERFNAEFRVVIIPAVHSIKSWQVPLLHRLVSRTSVLVTQEIRRNYRGYEIGTEDLSNKLPLNSIVVRIPVLYYEGLYPFQVYIRTQDGAVSAPITEYADLRSIAAAAQGLSDNAASAWFKEYVPPVTGLRKISSDSIANLSSRERSLSFATISSYVDHCKNQLLFHTVNHPSNDLLKFQAQEILKVIGINASLNLPSENEFLGDLRSPRHLAVLSALGSDLQSTDKWHYQGILHDDLTILEVHLRWLRTNPDVLQRALEQHSDKLSLLFDGL